ncbi:type VII secretion protein EccB [Nocardioides sp. T2.26MG-1]|uniref:type VII secretion protein EccB n=1 Tax=Nocardioides sp. T2.26MG-1 TaxID=3041166 RepID=UPI0024775C32|nr:type VII secretion protein EccB [Nocardioides sp. T2.26MG-1]CAI9401199.1 hypothetical protein HIDPHFAB_00561 [Nocardioides sp. T2.26MG-1]
MPTSSDLAQAASFCRRRLTGAFVAGAPGGREVDPGHPGRAVVGGLALAVLLGAGAAIAHVLAPRPPDDWASHGLVVSKETGQAYVVLPDEDDPRPADDGHVELHPVVNLASARLILGHDVDPILLPQDVIDEQVVAHDVGILGAPGSLPASDRLVESGWTACTADRRGVRVRVAAEPDVRPAPDTGLVVAVGHDFYLVASVQVGDEPPSAYALPLPGGDAVDNMLGALGLPARALAPRVPRAWLDLFPTGAPLGWASFGLTHAGERPGRWDLAGVPRGARVGDVLQDAAGDAVVMTTDGPADLDPFAFAVYAWTTVAGREAPRVFSVDRPPDLTRTRLPMAAAHWPAAPPQPMATDPCAVLVTAPDGPATVRLAQGPGAGFAAEQVRARRADVAVDPGRGALGRAVRAGGGDPSPVLIDSIGRANPLDGDAAARLGYADASAPVVPAAWMGLFGEGVRLSRELALCAPVGVTDGSCDSAASEG